MHFHSRKCIWKCRLENGSHLVSASMYQTIIVMSDQLWPETNDCWYLALTPSMLNLFAEHKTIMYINVLFALFLNIRGPFYWHRLTLIIAWISNQMPSKAWDEITYPFSNFNDATIEVWEWISNFMSLYNRCNCISMMGSKLIHVS